MSDYIVGAITALLILTSAAAMRGCIEVTENVSHVLVH